MTGEQPDITEARDDLAKISLRNERAYGDEAEVSS